MKTYYYQVDCIEECVGSPHNVFKRDGTYAEESDSLRGIPNAIQIQASKSVAGIKIDRVIITMLVKL